MAFRQHEFNDKNIYINDESELKFISPFACFVVGCTGSGKSWTVLKWLKNHRSVFRKTYTQIYYFYGSTFQDIFKDNSLKHVCFSNDLKLLNKLALKKHSSPGILCILDDLMSIAGNSDVIEQLYTKGSHHFNIDIINIIQNIFYRTPSFVTLKENSQYVFIKQFINESKLKILANSIGLDSSELVAAYTESINKDRFEGILVDNHISSNIRKIAKIRDRLTSDTPALYITHEKFDYYTRKNVLKQIGTNDYYLDFDLLKDKCSPK